MDNIYKNTNGLNTKLWGPIVWDFLHIISLNYPVNPTDKDKYVYFNVIKSLKYVLPCKKCRKNISKNLKDINYKKKKHYENRKNFINLIYKLHNEVNKKIGKDIVSYDTIIQYNNKYRAQK